MDLTGSRPSASPYHVPVMVDEVIELFRPITTGTIVDATLGGGGHSRALLSASPAIAVIGLDRDPDAMQQAPVDPRFRFITANFADLDRVMTDLAEASDERGAAGVVGDGVAGVLFDLGVSSHQLDTGRRGFSYHQAGPLDMRMGPDTGFSAGEVVNTWSRDDIAAVLRRFGEVGHAGRIADAIVRNRPIADTAELAAVVASAVPAAARRKRHPARTVFQAIRIAVNEELSALEQGLDAAIRWVRPGGRIVVISYHSLEDRIVKRRFAAETTGCECPPDLPVCACGRVAGFRSLARKALRPSEAEITRNPRARSARLRALERIAA